MYIPKMSKLINGLYYQTKASRLIATDKIEDYDDGSGWLIYLFETRHGRYFALNFTYLQGEQSWIKPLDINGAIELFNSLPTNCVEFHKAFPTTKIVRA